MDPISVGFLSILPPVIAIGLALITKEVISSLLIGVFFGTFTYGFASGAGVMKSVSNTFTLIAEQIGGNATMIIFLVLLGVVVVLVTSSGGAQAYGRWATTKIKSKRMAQLMTSLLGIIIFVDDYFNCLTVGTVMRPVTDRYGISRAKLAYLIDSTASPICIIAPVSSWAAAVGATLAASNLFESDIMAFIATIPYNLYALLTITMIVIVCFTGLSYGPMRTLESQAELEQIKAESNQEDEEDESGRVGDLVFPILGLIVFSLLCMLYTGGFFGKDGGNLIEAFGNCDSSLSLALGGFFTILLTFILYVPRKVLGFREFMDSIFEGIKLMIPAVTILVLAWTLSGACTALDTGNYIGGLVQASNFPMGLVPTIIFAVAAFLSFATGTAWGTFGILVPIVLIICEPVLKTDPTLMTVALSATLGGSVFGDHCSPISDTTILSSTGAQCKHIDHVRTQLPYALTVATATLVGYLVSWAADFNVFVTLIAGMGTLILLVLILAKLGGGMKPLVDEETARKAASE